MGRETGRVKVWELVSWDEDSSLVQAEQNKEFICNLSLAGRCSRHFWISRTHHAYKYFLGREKPSLFLSPTPSSSFNVDFTQNHLAQYIPLVNLGQLFGCVRGRARGTSSHGLRGLHGVDVDYMDQHNHILSFQTFSLLARIPPFVLCLPNSLG